MKKSLLRILPLAPLIVAALLFCPGCVTYATLEAASRVKATTHLLPVMHAIEKFKQDTGRLPASLDEVQARQKEPFQLEEKSKEGAWVWSINYELQGTSYTVSYNGSFADLYYKDGKYEGWSYNPWR